MAELKHKKCNGIVSVDIADSFTLRTHSIVITPTEMRLGVLELEAKPRGGKSSFVCNKCEEKFDLEEDTSSIVAMCLVCTRNKPISDLYVSYAFPCICEGCMKEISGESKSGKSELSEYLNVSKSSMKFVKLVDILKQPV